MPLIVRWPGHLTPASVSDDLVGWVDIAPTMLAISGAEIPDHYQGQVFLGDDLLHTRDYSDDTARVIDEEVQRILTDQEDRCRKLLTDHRNALDLIARSLLEHETISGDEVGRLVKVAAAPGSTPAPVEDPTTVD